MTTIASPRFATSYDVSSSLIMATSQSGSVSSYEGADFYETATYKMLAIHPTSPSSFNSASSSNNDNPALLAAYQYPLLVWALTIAYVFVLATCCVANLITLSYYFMNRNSQFIANPYVLSLLSADLLWPIVNVPYNVVYAWTPYWILPIVACQLIPFFQVIFPDIISLTLCAIAVERYFTIIYPYKDNPMLARRTAVATICLIWLVPIIVNGFLPFAHKVLTLPSGSQICVPTAVFSGFFQARQITTFKVVQAAVVLVGLPGVLFPFCYGQIILKVVRSQVALSHRATGASALAITAARACTITTGTCTPAPRMSRSSLSNLNRAVTSILVRQQSTSSYASTNGQLQSKKPEKAKRSTPEHRTRVVTMISILGQLAHFSCWTPIVVFQLWHVVNNYPPLTPVQLVAFKLLTLLASANPAWNSLSYTAVLRHRSHPRNRTGSHASTFGLLAIMVKNGSNSSSNVYNRSRGLTFNGSSARLSGAQCSRRNSAVPLPPKIQIVDDLSYNNIAGSPCSNSSRRSSACPSRRLSLSPSIKFGLEKVTSVSSSEEETRRLSHEESCKRAAAKLFIKQSQDVERKMKNKARKKIIVNDQEISVTSSSVTENSDIAIVASLFNNNIN